MEQLPAWILPVAAVALGAFALALAKASSWNFDRKHPHLSRAGMKTMERLRPRLGVSDVPMTRKPWVQPTRTVEVEVEVETSLGRLGRNVADDLNRKRADEQSAA